MSDLVGDAIRGIPFGCVYALVAIGLVLAYRTVGVLNLAFGAQAFVSAAVYYDARERHGWPNFLAFFFAVVVVAPLLGLVLHWALFRHLRSAPPIARLVSSLGLLVALPALVVLWFGSSPAYGPPSVSTEPDRIFRFGGYALDGNDVATIIATIVVVLALTAVLRYSSIGLRMRAVVESPRMVELTGINADRVSAFAWALSSFLAGLAGVLLAPLFAQVNATNFTNLLLAAIVAAAFGGLSSIPLTFVGGILLGVVQQIVAGSLPLDSVVAQGLRPSLPFALLLLLLLFRPGLRERREVTDPLAGVDPPPPGLAAATRSEALTRLTRWVAMIAAAVLLGAALFRLDDYWLGLLTQAAIFSTIFLSITLVTGFGGMLSLCQATFAAVGAFAAAQLGVHLGLAVLPAIVVGAAFAAVVGGLIALPALRLGGVHLALATLAFALMFDAVLVPLDWVGGGLRPVTVPRPLVASIDFTNDRAFFLLCVAVLAATGAAIVRLRRARTGRFLEALRGSEVGAMSVGIDPRRAKITAFAFSAGIAGLGGGLLASQQGEANAALFSPFFGLFWVVLVVTLGARTVEGAVNAGLAFMLFPEILAGLGLSPAYQFILFGLGAMTYARHPEGIVEANKRAVLAAIDRRIARRRSPTAPIRAADGTPVGAGLEP